MKLNISQAICTNFMYNSDDPDKFIGAKVGEPTTFDLPKNLPRYYYVVGVANDIKYTSLNMKKKLADLEIKKEFFNIEGGND